MEISGDAIGALARGCALLGSGGGGTTRTAEVIVQFYLGQFGPVQLLDVDELGKPAAVPRGRRRGRALRELAGEPFRFGLFFVSSLLAPSLVSPSPLLS